MTKNPLLTVVALVLLAPAVSAAQLDPRILSNVCDSYEFLEMVERESARARAEHSAYAFGMIAGFNLHQGEMHDCQRLVSGRDLGALVAVMVSSNTTGAHFDPEPGDTTARVIAEIVSYDGAYHPLKIRPGMNCLWIEARRPNDRPANLTAAMYQPEGRSCAFAPPPSAAQLAAGELEIRRLT